MQFDSTNAIKLDLEYQRKLLRSFHKRRNQITDLDKYSLRLQIRNEHHRYYLAWRENGEEKKKYLGKKQKQTISKLKEKYFLDHAIEACENNIFCLENLLQNYRSLDPVVATQNNPKPYRNPDEYSQLLFSQQTKSQWQRRMQREKDKRPVYKPQHLKHHAVDGTPTRSKSEALIYNLLLGKNITFIYELPLFIGRELMLPDFTIYDACRNRVVIIEHMGLMASGTYCEDQMKKLQNYIADGWIPNVNLILTFEDLKGNIDTKAINTMIEAILS